MKIEDFNELKKIISDFENKEIDVTNPMFKLNIYLLDPKCSKGSPAINDDARPHIRFVIDDKELKITHIYLIKQSQGLGTKIIDWFIKYCKLNSISKISIAQIDPSNNNMIHLAEHFNFKLSDKSNSNSLYYELDI